MKQFLLFCMCSYLILPSCQYSCRDAEISISLIGFTSNETDTIIVRKFTKSTGFSTILDTFSLNKTNSSYNLKNDTLEVNASYGTHIGLRSGYNYEIYLPENNKLYQISEIVEDYRSISNTGCTKESCINSITSYKLDGKIIPTEKYSNTFYISKWICARQRYCADTAYRTGRLHRLLRHRWSLGCTRSRRAKPVVRFYSAFVRANVFQFSFSLT